MSTPEVEVLVPTYRRPAALAVTLTSLVGQTYTSFGVVVSDQSESLSDRGELATVVRVLEARGHPVTVHHHLPRRGMAEQRAFLLAQARASRVLFLDDDVVLAPEVLERLVMTMDEQACGFVGVPLVGLSHRHDVRPHEQDVDAWDEPVRPEVVTPDSPAWSRHRLHNAANALHVEERLGLGRHDRFVYRVAWTGGCVLYDSAKLRAAGGFDFWTDLPPDHVGEDVLAQLRVMGRFGGCGVLPSGAYHQELETTLPERLVDAPLVLSSTSGTGPGDG